MTTIIHWLDPLIDFLGADTALRHALDTHLAAELKHQAGIEAHAGFVLLPENDHFETEQRPDGVMAVTAMLVGPDAWAEPVVLCWRGMAPAKDATPDTPRMFQAWWEELPASALRERYGGVIEHRQEASVPFAVTVTALAWPDAWIEIRTDRPLTERAVKRLEKHLEQRRAGWNVAHPDQLIHNFGGYRHIGPRRLEFYIDFGKAPKEELTSWIQAIADAPLGAEILQLLVRGYPTEAENGNQ
ncbi:hypothetical protein [Desulfatitalea tepidiphila]|uniref:hypothetical protein n=1 Tax=Desulfatitalea tepidiphila TaxID=1185843 RepID=UPI00128F5DF2|nr:hypothetical protein [Desulfatitalea tepidiphila]